MGRLVKSIFQIFFIFFLQIQFIDCDRGVADESYFIEWAFIDSLNPIEQISYKIDITTDKPILNRNRSGVIDSMGILNLIFSNVVINEFIEINPMFNVKLFKIDSTVIYDSLFTWEQMDFKEQFSVIDNEIRENVSKRTVYITTSAKSGMEQY